MQAQDPCRLSMSSTVITEVIPASESLSEPCTHLGRLLSWAWSFFCAANFCVCNSGTLVLCFGFVRSAMSHLVVSVLSWSDIGSTWNENRRLSAAKRDGGSSSGPLLAVYSALCA